MRKRIYRNLGVLMCTAFAAAGCEKKDQAPAPVSAAPAMSMLDLDALDRTVSPCDDFYQYACGNWIKKTEIPGDKSTWSRSFNTIDEKNVLALKTILENYARGDFSQPAKYAKKLGDYYASCMDESRINAETPAFVAEAFRQIDTRAEKELAGLIAELHTQGVGALFGFGSDNDAADSTKVIGSFSQGGLGLPERDYYFNKDAKSVETREKYVEHVAKMLTLAGFQAEAAAEAAQTVLRLETRLAGASLTRVEMRDPQKLHNPAKRAELATRILGFDAESYLKALGVSATAMDFNISVPKFFTGLESFLKETSAADLKVYLKWQFLGAMGPRLGQGFSDQSFAFNGVYLSGQKEQAPRWKKCISAAGSDLGEALGEAYVAVTFGAEGKVRAKAMITQLRTAFRKNLDQLPWLDAATRDASIAKLEKFESTKIGYPDEYRNYDAVEVERAAYLKNRANASRVETQRQVSAIGKPIDRKEWLMTPQMVNAYYNPPLNEIVFPAGILQPPFFHRDSVEAQNYGAIGMVIGHELSHGFDDQGSQYDGDGNLKDWWSAETKGAFKTRASCIVDQYSKYEPLPGLPLNGKQTLGENIADNGGLKISYLAYRASRVGKGEEATVGGFTPDQQFFLAFAQGWCSKSTEAATRLRTKTGVHSFPRFRVIGPVVNRPEFAQAFSCKAGSPMAPVNRCDLW